MWRQVGKMARHVVPPQPGLCLTHAAPSLGPVGGAGTPVPTPVGRLWVKAPAVCNVFNNQLQLSLAPPRASPGKKMPRVSQPGGWEGFSKYLTQPNVVRSPWTVITFGGFVKDGWVGFQQPRGHAPWPTGAKEMPSPTGHPDGHCPYGTPVPFGLKAATGQFFC